MHALSTATVLGRDCEFSIDELVAGRPVVVQVDGECQLVMLARTASVASTAFLIRHGSGLLIAAMDVADLRRLQVPAIHPLSGGPEFHVAVDAADGITTGISASDRARTIRLLADPDCQPASLQRPGHVMLGRVDLAENSSTGKPFNCAAMLAELAAGPGVPSVLTALESVDGLHTAQPDEGAAFADEHDLAFVSSDEISREWYRTFTGGVDDWFG